MLCTVATLTGCLTELTWAGAHMLTYASGIRAEQLGPEACHRPGTPVLLVHGLNDNRSVFMVMRRTLRRAGFTSVSCWNYSPLTGDIRRLAADLGQHIERIRAQTGHDRVHVVGHSLGGLIARYHAQRQDGDSSIESLVTLGTPHQGTVLALVMPTPLGRQLRPGSSLMQQLSEPAPGCRTATTAVYSDLDQVVLPTSSGRCDHPDLAARNVLVRGVGHLSLPVHPAVVTTVTAALRGHPTPTAGRPGPAAVSPPTHPCAETGTRPGGAAADAA
jgi:hypothetical protein